MASLPEPTFSFTIPSLYDGVRLECRLYHPASQEGSQGRFSNTANGMIIAHPYAPLGGCFDDPTVGAVGGELLKAGWIVGSFNLRGAGKSGGRTSWTGKPEMADYISFYGFMMLYLHEFEGDSPMLSKNDGGDEVDPSSVSRARLILSGYSYGSMLASYLPLSEAVLDLFSSSKGGRVAEEIKLTAHQLFTIWVRDPCREPSKIPVAKPSILYLLISPILPPVTFFTAMSLFKPHKTLDVVIQGVPLKSQRPEENLTIHRSLAVYGDDDVLTSVKKLRKWCAELEETSDSQFQHREVKDGGHFWLNDVALSQLKKLVREWLSATP